MPAGHFSAEMFSLKSINGNKFYGGLCLCFGGANCVCYLGGRFKSECEMDFLLLNARAGDEYPVHEHAGALFPHVHASGNAP